LLQTRFTVFQKLIALDHGLKVRARSGQIGEKWKIEMQAPTSEIRTRVMALVKAILEQNAITATIDPDTRLVDVGLTSMDMVNLMLGVEAEFDFTIPQSEITPENFQSVKTLELMVAGQLRAAA
jgi:acyl carrier protein